MALLLLQVLQFDIVCRHAVLQLEDLHLEVTVLEHEEDVVFRQRLIYRCACLPDVSRFSHGDRTVHPELEAPPDRHGAIDPEECHRQSGYREQ